MNDAETAKSIIRDNLYMTIATSDGKRPWASPVFYAIDRDYNFYFISSLDSVHARNIAKNPQVAIAIFDSRETGDDANGLQISGAAALVGVKDSLKALSLIIRKKRPGIKELPNIREYRIRERRLFVIRPLKFYIQDNDYWKKHHVDKRVEIRLKP